MSAISLPARVETQCLLAWLLCRGLIAALFAAAVAPGFAQPSTKRPSLETNTLRLAIPRLAFADLNENDASAAYRAFVVSLAWKRGYELQAEVLIFDELPKLEFAVRNGTVNVAILGTWQLLQSGLRDIVDVEFVPSVGGTFARRMVLLTRRGNRMRGVADLSGKSVLVLIDSRTTLGRPWLNTLCLEAGVGPAELHFGAFTAVGRPNSAILPVFFGRADACVVDEQTFATACELNPQLGRVLVPIACSEPMVDSVVCLNRIGWESVRRRDDLRQGLLELHIEPAGRQALTLFRFDRLIPLEPSMLDSVVALYSRYSQVRRNLLPPAEDLVDHKPTPLPP